MDRLNAHYDFIKNQYEPSNIVGIFLCGSQNYGTDLPTSDIDSKVLIAPTLSDIYTNKKGESVTRIFPNSEEQIVVKDVRCAFSEFKKQNINSVEILFTDYCIINPLYKETWQELINHRDTIVDYDPILTVRTTKGIAFSYYAKLYNKETQEVNCKAAANLLRIEYYLKKYIDQKPYIECLRPQGETLEYIKQIRQHEMGSNSIITLADSAMTNIKVIADAFCDKPSFSSTDFDVEELLNKSCKDIIDTAFFSEYTRNGEFPNV